MTDAGTIEYNGSDLESLYEMPRYQRWILSAFAEHLLGETVELGAGLGAMSRHLEPRVQRLDLVEPAPHLADRLQARFGDDPKIRIYPRKLEDYLANRQSRSRDRVIMITVLEHIEDDAAALAAIHQVLRPGGYALIFVPAMPFLFSRMDRALGHKRRYTRSGLDRLAKECGFQVVELRYFDLIGIIPWWLVNTLGGSTAFDGRLCRLYDAICVPVGRAAESFLTPPVGKNLILIARRPAS